MKSASRLNPAPLYSSGLTLHSSTGTRIRTQQTTDQKPVLSQTRAAGHTDSGLSGRLVITPDRTGQTDKVSDQKCGSFYRTLLASQEVPRDTVTKAADTKRDSSGAGSKTRRRQELLETTSLRQHQGSELHTRSQYLAQGRQRSGSSRHAENTGIFQVWSLLKKFQINMLEQLSNIYS